MKRIKKLMLVFVVFTTTLTIAAFVFDVDYLFKAIRTVYLTGHTTAYLDDYKQFDNEVIQNSSKTQPWNLHKKYNQVSATPKLLNTHKNLGTVAFLIIKNDSIWHESYYDGYNQKSLSNSFSMAKSIVSAALGKAILLGKIKSLNEPVANYFPQIKNHTQTPLTVGDLSSMSSGLNWDEDYYSPFSVTTRAYFDTNLKKIILGLEVVDDPGVRFKYLSGNTQLLAMVIEKATGERLEQFVSKQFWQPMGAEQEALWQTDSANGMVKSFCCIASNARDFARFGKLYKDFGKWNGKQILDSGFVAKSIAPRFQDSPQYGYGWWLSNYKNKKIAYMRGHLGQNVIIIPEDNLIIVRLGHQEGDDAPHEPHKKSFFTFISETYKMLEQ